VRMMFRVSACAALALGLGWTWGKPATTAAAQELLPDQSAAKAKQLLQQVITALGGQAYLNVRDSECVGRISQFGTVGDVADNTDFRQLWLLPDKNRTEYTTQSQHSFIEAVLGFGGLYLTHGGAIVTVFNGDQGWQLDKAGVSDDSEEMVKDFKEQLMSDMNNMLRIRLKEPGVEASYAGPDLIDMKEAEWIEFTDGDHRNLRLGIDKLTHLPLRWVVTTRDPETRVNTEVSTKYTQYMTLDGVKAPLSLEVTRNDRRVSQTFLSSCKFNSDITPELFTRAALEQRASQETKKGFKDKDSKKTK
jgi:hypothetical protein